MKIEDIDLQLEKLVFLLNAEEGNPGIYELTWELGYYDLTIEDKYKIARMLLTELVMEDLVVLERYKDHSLNVKIETIEKNDLQNVLNNPTSWYPNGDVLSITLTENGNNYLDNEMPLYKNRIVSRLTGKIN